MAPGSTCFTRRPAVTSRLSTTKPEAGHGRPRRMIFSLTPTILTPTGRVTLLLARPTKARSAKPTLSFRYNMLHSNYINQQRRTITDARRTNITTFN